MVGRNRKNPQDVKFFCPCWLKFSLAFSRDCMIRFKITENFIGLIHAGEGIGRTGNQWENRNHSEDSIIEIGLNSQKSLGVPGDWWSLRLQRNPTSSCWWEKLARSGGERDETIIHVISECSKLAQEEYKTRHDWVGKVIHWELCGKFEFEYMNKWYMHNLASVLENETHKLRRDFDIQTDHLISARRLDLISINKKEKVKKKERTCWIVDIAVPAGHRVKLKESEKKDKYLDLTWKLKRLWNMKVTVIPIVVGALGTITECFVKVLENIEIRGWMETIQTTALLRSAKILRKVLETWGDLLSLKI